MPDFSLVPRWQRGFLRFMVLLGLLLSLGAGAAPGAGGRDFDVEARPGAASGLRVALVIGNAAYRDLPLRNPVNDARAISAELKALNFNVILRENLTTRQIGSTLREFRNALKPGSEAIFFYAGHGLQIKGVNYLPAVDAEISDEEDVPNQSLSLDQVMSLLNDNKTRLNLVFLDACRNNPFSRRFRSAAAEGLARVNAPSGTLISFATRPGSVAADGTGSHGLYTEHLLAQMKIPNQPVEQVLKATATAVKRASQSKQEPWQEGSIEGNFYFIFTGPATVNVQQPAAVAPQANPEEEAWNAARDSNSAAAVQVYLDQYPRGRYAAAAKVLLAKLRPAPVPVAAPVPAVPVPRPPSAAEIEQEVWEGARASNSVEVLEEYLKQYPKGRYAGQARLQVAKLKAEARQAAAQQAAASRPVPPVVAQPAPVSESYTVGRSFRDCNDKSCPEMVVLPSGSFLMGSPKKEKDREDGEGPQHRVNISYRLAVGKYEVTRGQFAAFVQATGHDAGNSCWVWTGDQHADFRAWAGAWADQSGKSWRDPGYSQSDEHPVVCVNWNDAQAYVRWLSQKTGKQYRLLSESEWEYAARAGTTTRYSFGDDESLLDQYAWYGYEKSGKQTHPVGEKRPNAFGLHDMHGSVWEWVQDCETDNYNGAPNNGGAVESNNCARRILRGGSWVSDPYFLRAAFRVSNPPGYRNFDYGFRVVRTLP